MQKAARILISYSHEDRPYRMKLERALAGLVRSERIEIWSDHQLLAGESLDDAILAQLKEADIIVILVSPDFVASDYCFKKELQIALERNANGRASVIPIYIRPTDTEGLPFDGLKGLPYGRKPVSVWVDPDEAWLDISKGIRDHLADRSLSPDESKSKELSAHLSEGFDYLQMRYVEIDNNLGVHFGIKKIDEITDGVLRNELALIAGRPDHGHVEAALGAVISGAISGGKKVLVLSQRMSAVQYSNRLICAVGLIDRSRFARGLLEDDDWKRVVGAIRILRDKAITIDDDPIRTSCELKEKLSGIDGRKYDLVVLDGIEYTPSANGQERGIAIALKDFARRS